LATQEQRRRDEPKYGGDIASIETEHWLRVFSDALAASETAEAQPAPDSPGSSPSAKPDRARRRPSAGDKPEGPSPRLRDEPPGARNGRDGSSPSTEDTGAAELAFWQARVDELRRESVDPARPGAENPGGGS
jgi:hypothetical protein